MTAKKGTLTLLVGKKGRHPTGGLEVFSNPSSSRLSEITLHCEEFTSTCPITGQPDFGEVIIEYRPDKWCIESKSLKLYLWTYREKGTFCEALSVQILRDIVKACSPPICAVTVIQRPRGGIGLKAKSTYYKGVNTPTN
jgi:7-cyano-7-deazaguanine reductase